MFVGKANENILAVWTGGYYEKNEWKWSDGNTMKYTNWVAGL
jgi:hypothetical protein